MVEIYLNIYMSGMIQFFSDSLKKVFHFTSAVVSSTLGTTEILERVKMASFFADAYPELCRAHATKAEGDFNALIWKVRPNLVKYAGKLSMVRPLGAIDFDDYVQVGVITIWRKLPDYRYICPVCDQRFPHSAEYIEHCKREHGDTLEPVKTLEQYLNYSIKAYMKNHLRSMSRSERKPDVFVPGEPPVGSYSESLAGTRPDVATISRLAVERLEYLVTKETNPKVRMLVAGCLDGDERPVIWEHMAAAGLAKTPKSACVCVNRLMKRREVWREYRAALA